MSYNLKFSFLITFIFISVEFIFRVTNIYLVNIINIKDIFLLFLLFFLMSFIRSSKIYTFFIFLIIIFYFFQMVNFLYFGSWISPISIYLFFTHFIETFQTLNTELKILILPSLLTIVLIVLFLFIYRKFKQNLMLKSLISYFLLFLLLLEPLIIIVTDKNSNTKVQKSDLIIKTTWKSISYFVAKIMPKKLFNNEKNTFVSPPIKNNKQNNYKNIVFIIGESMRTKNLSLFGYTKNTTPNLNKISEENRNFLYKNSISSAVFTDVSIPFLINCIDQPDKLDVIVSQQQCLFKLAKNSGYYTHFISSQSYDALNSITSNICINYIDNYKNSYSNTHDIYMEQQDNYLYKELKKINLSKSNFIILHQSGSHSPYSSKYPTKFSKFGNSKIDTYDNTILYSDYIYKNIIDYLKKSKYPTLLIYTSDHGESLGENGINGHGLYYIKEQYQVPFFIYSINKNLNNQLKQSISNMKYITHYKISKILAYYLGYKINNETIKFQKKIFVMGKDIEGLDGYKVIK